VAERTFTESFKVAGAEVVEAIKRLVREGNVRRVIVRQDSRIVAEFPLTAGVIGTVFSPVLAAIGALAALLNDCTIEVERVATVDDKGSGDDKEAAHVA